MRPYTKFILALALLAALAGCARAAKDTTGYAVTTNGSLNAPFEEAWQATKAVLREQELELYTRDKRGAFVAYSPMTRQLGLFTPRRVQYTINLEEASATQTDISIETVRQVYGVTLLTYPDWHERPAEDDGGAQAILTAVQAKISGVAPASDATQASAATP